MTILLTTLALVFGLGLQLDGVPQALVVLVFFMPFVWGLGILAAAITLTFRRGAGVVGLGVAALTLVSGLYFPVGLLPGWLTAAAQANPLAIAAEALREALLGGADWSAIGPDILILTPLSLALVPRSARSRSGSRSAASAGSERWGRIEHSAPDRRSAAATGRGRPRRVGSGNASTRWCERAPRESDLRYHGLEQVGAARSRRGAAAERLAAERTAIATSLIAPLVLQRVLAAVEEPVVLMKGPEVAQWWHDPLTRPYRDLDVLVEDSEATWRTLREAGFQPTGDPELYLGIHHLRPLVWPGLPLVVEVHHEPKWIEGMRRRRRSCCETAVPSATGIPGLLALEPARHAVALAVHAWAHVPLGRLGRLVDVAALSQGADRDELARDRPRAGTSSGSGGRRRPRSTRSSATGGGRSSATSGRGTSGASASERCSSVTSSSGSAPFSALPPGQAAAATRRHRRAPVRACGRRDAPADDQALAPGRPPTRSSANPTTTARLLPSSTEEGE